MAGDEIARGHAAQRLLDDDTIKDVLSALEADYVKQWRDAQTAEAREVAWHSLKALDDLQARLRRLRDSGTRAQRATA